MKTRFFLLFLSLFLPVWAAGLQFSATQMMPSTNDDLLHILPRQDRLEEPTAIVFIKTDIKGLTVRGNISTSPRKVRGGYILCIPQGTTQLKLNAPLYTTSTVRFDPVQGGKHYEITVFTQADKKQLRQALAQAEKLDESHTDIGLNLELDYMELPSSVREQGGALIFLDKVLNFTQWQKLLKKNAPYEPFDINGNPKDPCCLVVPANTPVEDIFRLGKVDFDSYVEEFEAGNTYHTILTFTPKP